MNLTDPQDVLARTIWGEARGDGAAGMSAVADVILNRLAISEEHAERHPSYPPYWWGGDLISICLKPAQFDCWNSEDPNRTALEEVDDSDPTFVEALSIARQAIEGTLLDSTEGATSYKASWEGWPPSWPMPPVRPLVVIGHQEFYNLA